MCASRNEPGVVSLANLLPMELLLKVAAELENAKDVLAFAGTCRQIRWVLASLARPCVELRYPDFRATTIVEEERTVLARLGFLSSMRALFRCSRFVIHDDGHRCYASALLFLRDTIIRGLPHLFVPIAETLTADQIRTPMNGTTLQRIAERRGYLEVVEFIQSLPAS